jgi:hypothetical protein
MSVDINSLTRSDASLAAIIDWAAAYTSAGCDLAHLASDGHLRRGLRDTLAHHVIFAANRLGLPAAAQAVLATTASTVVFGDSVTHSMSRPPATRGVASPAATGPINGIEEHRC